MKRGDIVTGMRLAADMIACGKLLPSEGERGRELALVSLPPEFDALQPVFANPETEDQVLWSRWSESRISSIDPPRRHAKTARRRRGNEQPRSMRRSAPWLTNCARTESAIRCARLKARSQRSGGTQMGLR